MWERGYPTFYDGQCTLGGLLLQQVHLVSKNCLELEDVRQRATKDMKVVMLRLEDVPSITKLLKMILLESKVNQANEDIAKKKQIFAKKQK